MLLDPPDAVLVFALHRALMLYVNDRLKIGDAPSGSTDGFPSLGPELRLEVRDALAKRLDLIDDFVAENPYQLDSDDLAIVASWKHMVAGAFYVLRFLKKHTIFLQSTDPPVAYGVLGLSEPLSDVIKQRLPYLCQAVLLPFQGKIVYDSVLSGYNISFGGNINRLLRDAYNLAKARSGVVTSLPWQPPAIDDDSRLISRSTKKTGRRGGETRP
jgi:hypothetical protein